MKRNHYTPEFKAKVVLELLREEKTLSQIAADYGVHPNLLSRWKAEFLEKMPTVFSKEISEVDKLRKEHASEKEELIKQIGQLSVENVWFKKNLSESLGTEAKKKLIQPIEGITVKRQCELLGVSRSTVYYQPKKLFGPGPEEIRIKNAIDRIWTNKPYFGYRRIRAALKGEQIFIGKKRLIRYMREMGITAIYPGPNLSRRNLQHRIYPYLLRGVNAECPNQVWGIDLTYVGMRRGWMYLVVIIDWYSRMVVGHAYSNTLHVGFVIECVKEAIRRHGHPQIMNSDQGSHFTSDDYINLLKKESIRISMNGRGRFTDNAITERFIRSLKQERLYLEEFEDPRQLKRITSEYIDDYNWQRPHQSLGYKTPSDVYCPPWLAQEAI
ncbi:MAG: IS3 family transposase [Peptococcaceae bacterium]|nr:IS3 family transposase [Peptococcaceae bacterium]